MSERIQARGLQRGDVLRVPDETADQFVMDAYQLDARTVVAELFSEPTSGLDNVRTFRADELVHVTRRATR